MRTAIEKIIESWKNTDGNVNTTQNLLSWIRELNLSTFVSVKAVSYTHLTLPTTPYV